MNVLLGYRARILARIEEALRQERGDVPGWVLITIMTAGLVTALWQIAGTELMTMFKSALHGVSG